MSFYEEGDYEADALSELLEAEIDRQNQAAEAEADAIAQFEHDAKQ